MRLPTVLLLSFISLCKSQFGFGFGGPAEEDFNDQFGLKESLGAWGNVLRNVAHRQLFGRPTPPPTDFQRITPPPNVEKIDPKLIANNGNEIINSRLLNMLLPRFKGQAPDVIAPHSKSQEEAATRKKKHQKSTTTASPDSYEDEDDDDDGEESTTVASTTITPTTAQSTTEATTVTTTTTEQSTTITTTTVENTTTKEAVTETTTEAPSSTTTTETTSTAKLAVKFHTAAKEKYDNDLEKEIEDRVRQVVQELLDERLGKKKEATKKIDEMKKELKKEEVEKKKTGKVGESAEMEGHMKTIEEWIDEKVQKAMKSEDQSEQEKSEKSTNNDDNKPNAEKKEPENEHSDKDTSSTTVEPKLEKSEKMSTEETVVAKKTEDTSSSTFPTSTSSAKAESTTLITTTTEAKRETTKKPAKTKKEPTKKDSKKEEKKKTAKSSEEKVEKKKSIKAHPKNVKHKKLAEDKAHKDFKVLKAVSMEDGTIDDVDLFKHYKTILEDGKVNQMNKELEADYLNGEYEDEDEEKLETDDNLEMVEASGEPDEEAIDEDDIEETLSGENSSKTQKSPTIPEAEEEEEIAKEDDKYFRAHDAVTDAVSTTQEAGEETTLKPTTGTNVFNLQANANSDSHPNIANVMTPIAGIIDGISPILFPLLQSRPGMARAAARGAPNYQPDGNRDLLMDAQPETSLVGFGTQLAREILQPGSLQRDREEQEKAMAARAAAAKEKLRQKEVELQQYERQQEAQKQRLIERERSMNPARSNNPQPRVVENNVAFEQAFQGSSSFKQEIDTPTGPLLITPPPGVKGGKVPPPPPPGYIPKGYTGPIPPPDFVPQFLTSNEDSQSKPSPVKIENGPPPRKLSDERKRFSDLVKKRQGGLLAGDNSGSQAHAASIGQPLFGLVGNNGAADTAFGSASDNGLGFGGGKHPSVPFEEVERNTEKEESNFFG